ncbi:MAG: methionyl-tRNA formyltransferase [Desulforegulaceae bacterium]|nr:methionyl-tRNA formyltransferase [Desulforegulaceae bacterium]
MDWKDYKIIFMGTPEFAAVPLRALKNEGFNICLAVTQPDRKQGRGKKILPPPVKMQALNLGIEVFQPEKIKEPEAMEKIKSLNPDFLIVAAYGQILPKKLLEIPKFAPINIHASILPFYRGASPIQHAILNMEKETGITTMFMDEGLDTGDILHIEKIKIHENDTAGSLHDRLGSLGADAIIFTLKNFEKIKRQKQDNRISTYAPLLKKENGHLNWKETADKIDAKIRAFDPWPGTFTFLDSERLKIFSVEKTLNPSIKSPGTIIKADEPDLIVSTGNYDLIIKEIQPAGKKKMSAAQFLKGYNIRQGAVLN